MPDFPKVKPGDALNISATAWNTMQDAARDYLSRSGGAVSSGSLLSNIAPSTTVIVRNDTGSLLAYPGVLKLGDPVISATDAPQDVQQSPGFEGTEPAATTDAFAIMIEPLEEDAFGRGVVAGVAVCDIDVTDEGHEFATPKAGDATQLASAASGPARVVWKESGTGTKRAVVLVGQAGAGDSCCGWSQTPSSVELGQLVAGPTASVVITTAALTIPANSGDVEVFGNLSAYAKYTIPYSPDGVAPGGFSGNGYSYFSLRAGIVEIDGSGAVLATLAPAGGCLSGQFTWDHVEGTLQGYDVRAFGDVYYIVVSFPGTGTYAELVYGKGHALPFLKVANRNTDRRIAWVVYGLNVFDLGVFGAGGPGVGGTGTVLGYRAICCETPQSGGGSGSGSSPEYGPGEAPECCPEETTGARLVVTADGGHEYILHPLIPGLWQTVTGDLIRVTCLGAETGTWSLYVEGYDIITSTAAACDPFSVTFDGTLVGFSGDVTVETVA